MTSDRNRTAREKGQVLVMSALFMVVLLGAAGLAVDAGRIFVARAQLVRSLDAAALAGTLELPSVPNATTKVQAYMTENEPTASVTVANSADRQIEVHGSMSVNTVFMRMFGINSVTVSASATAGFGVLAVDTVLTIDATGSMGSGTGCPNGASCPIVAAKNAATSFTDTLLSGSTSSSETLVGVTPYRGCFNTPNPFSFCIPISSMVQSLSNNKTTVESKINAITAVGGSGTNICNGLNQANQILFGAGHHTVSNMLHIVVILSDGDNTYNMAANGVPTPTGHGSTPTPNPSYQLPAACRPANPNQSTDDTGTSCMPAQTHQRDIDIKTKALVDSMKANGVEIYVVGFGVCGSSSTALCDTSKIGGNYDDTTANRNLLKCLASSTAGTNDHYYEAATATDLPGIFTNIARLIGFRLIK